MVTQLTTTVFLW